MPIRTLAEAISHYGHDSYLLTVAQDGPHTSHVRPLPGTSRANPTYRCSGRPRSPAAMP
jgi:hypothetical protein